jgi:hypothetical protein
MWRRRGTALGLMLALAIAGGGLSGCGKAVSGNGVASANGGKGHSATPSASPSKLGTQEALLKFAQCMREHGINMPDPQVQGSGSGPGSVQIQVGAGSDPAKTKVAQEACKQYLPNGGDAPKPDAQALEQLRKLAKCMREHGLPNFPDPDPNGGLMLDKNSGITPNDPKFKAATEACKQYQPSGKGGTVTNGTGGGQ